MSDEKSLAVLQQETRVWLEAPERLAELKKVVLGMEPEQLIGQVMTAHLRNPDLIPCTLQSKWLAIKEAAQLGLPIGGSWGFAYLVPYRDHGVWKCRLDVDYKGWIQLALRHPRVLDIWAENVHDRDFFKIRRGTTPSIEHQIEDGERGEFRGSYACALLKGGGRPFRYLTAEEIEKRRKVSRNKDGMAWTDWPEEMRKKTAIRALRKFIPMSPELIMAMGTDEEDHEQEDRPAPSLYVPATASVEQILDAVAEQGPETPLP